MEIGSNKNWWFYEWVASERELSREFGGKPASLLGSGFLGVWPFGAEIIFFIFSCGIVGSLDLGLPFGRARNLGVMMLDSNIRR